MYEVGGELWYTLENVPTPKNTYEVRREHLSKNAD